MQRTGEYNRYCPGEEQIFISDAVCYGRRRNNFPKCKGCQFNDDEKGDPSASLLDLASTESDDTRRREIESIFRTQDIRAPSPDPLDDEAAWRIGLATSQFLRSELRGYDRSRPEKAAVVVGTDMRKTSPALREALIEGLRTGGSSVIDIGMIDTPQLWFAVNTLTCCGGVQITGGEAPARENGFLVCGQRARPVGSETGLGKICKIAKNTIRHDASQAAGKTREDLAKPYRAFVRGFLNHPDTLEQPTKIVVDASNGMAGHWLPILLDDLEQLEIVRLNFDHNGEFIHDPDPGNPQNLTQLTDRMSRANARFGVCFDGDADLCTFVDETGRVIRPDLIGALLARHLLRAAPGATVAYDLRCSRIVPEEIRKAGGTPRRVRAGSAHLKKTLADAKGLFGTDLDGRCYFQDNWSCDSAIITLIQVLNLLGETGRPLSELIEPLDRYAHAGEQRFESDNPSEAVKQLTDRYGNARIDHLDGVTAEFDDWWFNLRPHDDNPAILCLALEAAGPDQLAARKAEIAPLLGKPLNP